MKERKFFALYETDSNEYKSAMCYKHIPEPDFCTKEKREEEIRQWLLDHTNAIYVPLVAEKGEPTCADAVYRL